MLRMKSHLPLKMASLAASLIVFAGITNNIFLAKAITIGFLIEERFDTVANSSIFPELCLERLPEIFGVQVIVRKYHIEQPEDLHYHVNDLVSKQCHVIMTYASCEMQELIQVYLSIHGRSHVPLPDTHCFRANGRDTRSSPVRMRPKNKLLMEAIVSLIAHLRWTETNIIMDGSFRYQQQISLMSGLSQKGIRFTLQQLNYTNATFESAMKRYKPRIPTSYFLALMDREGTIKTLKAASRLNLIRYNTQWIIGNLDVNDADLQQLDLDPDQVNIAAFRQPCSAFLKSHGNKSTMSMMELTILQSVLSFLNRCLNIIKSGDHYIERKQNSTPKSFHSTTFSPNQEDITLSPFSVLLENEVVDQYQIVRVDKLGDHLEFLHIGEWCATNKEIIQTNKKFFPNAQLGFGNRILKVAFNEMRPYVFKKKGSDPPEYIGFNIDILYQLSLNLNFRYNFTKPADELFGTLNTTSREWSGVIGMVARNEVDLGVDPLTLTYERFSAVDYTQPYMEDGMSILMKRPNGNPADLLQSYRVFAGSTWIAFAVCFLLSFTILTVVNRGSAYVRGKGKVPKPSRSYKYNFWLMFGYSLQEGAPPTFVAPGDNGAGIEPVNTPGRIIVGFWWLFIILVSTNYTANLAAFLTVPVNHMRIKDVHDLAQDNTYIPITIYGSDKFQYFQSSTNVAYRSIGQKMESGPHYKCDSPIIKLVDSHNYAFISDQSLNNYLASKRCGFYLVISDPNYKQSLGFVLPKGSPYREMISSSIISMQEAGLIEKYKKRWWNYSAECLAPSEEKHMKASGLKMNTIGGAFIIYICVAILGILGVIIEMLIAWLNGRRKRNSQSSTDDT